MTPGRQKKEVDWKQFRQLCAWKCTEKEIASFFEMEVNALYKRCKEEYGRNFQELRDEFALAGNCSLRRAQFALALEDKNPTMLIFLGKKYLGQEDGEDKCVVFNINTRGQKVEQTITVKEKTQDYEEAE